MNDLIFVFISQVTWDVVIQDAFGGPQQASSAHTLVYIDALKIDLLLGKFVILIIFALYEVRVQFCFLFYF